MSHVEKKKKKKTPGKNKSSRLKDVSAHAVTFTHTRILDADLRRPASPISWGWVTEMHQTHLALEAPTLAGKKL